MTLEKYQTLQAVLILALVVVAYLGWWARECRCGKCAFHVNEARVKRLRQAEANHDAQHKGFGWGADAKDQFPCHDAQCSRNPRVDADDPRA